MFPSLRKHRRGYVQIDIETGGRLGLEETVGIHRARYLIIRRLIIPVIDRYR